MFLSQILLKLLTEELVLLRWPFLWTVIWISAVLELLRRWLEALLASMVLHAIRRFGHHLLPEAEDRLLVYHL